MLKLWKSSDLFHGLWKTKLQSTTANTIRPVTTQVHAPLVPTDTTDTATYLVIAVNISVLFVRNVRLIASASSTAATNTITKLFAQRQQRQRTAPASP